MLDQNFNHEIIVSDGHNTDKTVEITEKEVNNKRKSVFIY
jgi:glycosyltransferase involved in cell wall biosynthesis